MASSAVEDDTGAAEPSSKEAGESVTEAAEAASATQSDERSKDKIGDDDSDDLEDDDDEDEVGGGAPAKGLEDAESEQKDSKDKGNEEYEKGDFDAAVKAWKRSLQSVKYIQKKGFYDQKPEQQQEVQAMEIRLCLNIAQGYLKTKDWASAEEHADKVLGFEPANPKALYRKASAMMQMYNYSEVITVLEKLLQVEPDNKAAKDMMAKAQRSKEVSDRKAKKMSQRMFSNIERDPRVPPTQREALVEFVRTTWSNALGFVLRFPQLCQELLSPRRAQQRGQAMAQSVLRWLQTGILKRWFSAKPATTENNKED